MLDQVEFLQVTGLSEASPAAPLVGVVPALLLYGGGQAPVVSRVGGLAADWHSLAMSVGDGWSKCDEMPCCLGL